MAMIEEVRRQFKTIPGLMEGKGVADYAKCVDISTAAAIREMVLPGLMAVVVPVAHSAQVVRAWTAAGTHSASQEPWLKERMHDRS